MALRLFSISPSSSSVVSHFQPGDSTEGCARLDVCVCVCAVAVSVLSSAADECSHTRRAEERKKKQQTKKPTKQRNNMHVRVLFYTCANLNGVCLCVRLRAAALYPQRVR